MNWLAHVYLSEPDDAFRVGNLLPDLLPIGQLTGLHAGLQRGIAQHRRIDAFTDAHPIFRRSVQRIDPAFRRFGGILCDIFYDHFLARDWTSHSTEPLPDFTHAVYGAFDRLRLELPPETYRHLSRIRADDLLGSYRELAGISRALERLSLRFRRPVFLEPAISILEREYDSLHADFLAFFPELQAHLEGEKVHVRCHENGPPFT